MKRLQNMTRQIKYVREDVTEVNEIPKEKSLGQCTVYIIQFIRLKTMQFCNETNVWNLKLHLKYVTYARTVNGYKLVMHCIVAIIGSFAANEGMSSNPQILNLLVEIICNCVEVRDESIFDSQMTELYLQ